MNKSKKDYSASAVDKFLSRSDEEEPEATETPKKPKTSETSNISRISNISKISQTSKKPGPTPMLSDCYTLCLRLTHDDKAYLEQASWEHHQNVTEYLRNLIKADRAANGTKSRGKGRP
jgi:hypothetical protein